MSDKVCQVITDRILKALDSGVVPWRQPWRGGNRKFPCSFQTKKSYRGINIFLLWHEQLIKGYSSNYWLTFNQAKALGGYVKTSEQGTPVIFWKILEKEKTTKSGETKTDTIPLLRYYTVFNLDQCEGITDSEVAFCPGVDNEIDPIEQCEQVVQGFANGPTVQHTEARAWYKTQIDTVNVLELARFENASEYYSVLFHEFAHSTGHNSRLNRKAVQDVNFGSEQYSNEELIAELGSAMLCGICEIDNATLDNSASYIDYWRKQISEDPKLIIQCASSAQKAVDRILGVKFENGKKDQE